jgi:hypothetical protein
MDSWHEMSGFSGPLVLRTVRVQDCARDPEADGAVDTALTAVVMVIIGVEGVDFIPQKLRLFIACMGNERLFLAQL